MKSPLPDADSVLVPRTGTTRPRCAPIGSSEHQPAGYAVDEVATPGLIVTQILCGFAVH